MGGGTPNKTFGFAQVQSPGFHVALWLPDLKDRRPPPGSRGAAELGPPLSGLWVPSRGPALFGSAGRAPPPPPPPAPRSWRWWRVSLSFLQLSVPPLLFLVYRNAVGTAVGEEREPLIDRFLLRSFFALGLAFLSSIFRFGCASLPPPVHACTHALSCRAKHRL